MNKKFIFLLTLTLGMIMSSCSYAFSDVSEHWAGEIIENAKNINIIKGYSNDLFMPDAYMTRAELATVIDRLFVIETETDKYIPDVTRQDWFYSDIRKAMSMGIIQGDQVGNINPNNFVTREEAVLIIARAFNIKINKNETYYNNYLDSDQISEWAKAEFLAFIREGYINGYLDNTVRPKSYITRAEILVILNRIADINTKNNIYSAKLNKTTVIRDTNVQMTNVEIYGDLIIGETAAHIIKLNNVIINGNLILYAPISETDNLYAVNGEVIKIYENIINSNLYYNNQEYGISFSIPDGSTVFNSATDKVDYSAKDLIVIDILQNNDYYFKSLEDIAEEEIEHQNYDSIFRKKEKGQIAGNKYILYTDKVTSNLLFVKRDNTVYKLLFLNVVSNNIVDNVISNIEFFNGSKLANHNVMEYENSKLCLRFTYRQGYVGIDDSYNTGIVYSGDSFFKLFIQVNKITDIGDYSLKQVKLLLKGLVQNDGTLVKEEEKKVATHDAFQFEIESENDKIISLYVIIGNNLYNFIFKGDKNEIDSVGKEMFTEIVNSMEF